MKKTFGTNKLDRAISEAYACLYRQQEFIKFSAKQIASDDFSSEREYEDLLNDIVREYQGYQNLKNCIELLESVKEEDK